MNPLSRRELLLGTATAATGTALGGLLATGADLRPTVARAQELRIKSAKVTPSETFIERLPNGTLVSATTAIFSLGGATLECEWNHIHQKLMRGLGIVAIENQARI